MPRDDHTSGTVRVLVFAMAAFAADEYPSGREHQLLDLSSFHLPLNSEGECIRPVTVRKAAPTAEGESVDCGWRGAAPYAE
jgi:hypothetical protein